MQVSTDIRKDIKILEERTGMKAQAAQRQIAAGEPPFIIDVDGTPVVFAAEPARRVVLDGEGTEATVRMLPQKGHFDEYRARVVRTAGSLGSVSRNGLTTLRFTNLLDWQRGVILILRGAAYEFDLKLKGGVRTVSLRGSASLVTSAGEWGAYLRLAADVLNRIAAGDTPCLTPGDGMFCEGEASQEQQAA